jgi:hypothetical protein
VEPLELKDELGVLVAKIYFSPDKRKVRFVLPSLKNFAQVKIDIDHHLVDFTRDTYQALRECERPWKKP